MGVFDSTPLSGFFYNEKDDDRKALEGINYGKEAYDGLVSPTYQDVDFQGPAEAADIRVSPAALERVGPTAFNDVSVDPSYRSTQLAHISALEALRDGGGMNAADRANLNKIAMDESNREQSQRAAIMQNARMRGVGGSNAAIMDQLSAAQSGANRQSQRDMEIAGMAQDRALAAGNSAAGLAGNMSNQDFQQQSAIASARDSAAKFNSQMTNQNNQFNAGQDFRVQATNQGKSQGVNNARATAQNETQKMNRYTMPTQGFQNKLGAAQGKASVGNQQADYYGKKMSDAKKAQSGLWGGALTTAMSMFGKAAGGGSGAASQTGEPYNNSKAGMGNNENIESGVSSGPETTTSAPASDEDWNRYVKGYAYGGEVPGEAPYEGDSYANDMIPARLSPGEVVVPRSMTSAPKEEIGDFVQNADSEKEARMRALMSLRNRGV